MRIYQSRGNGRNIVRQESTMFSARNAFLDWTLDGCIFMFRSNSKPKET